MVRIKIEIGLNIFVIGLLILWA